LSVVLHLSLNERILRIAFLLKHFPSIKELTLVSAEELFFFIHQTLSTKLKMMLPAIFISFYLLTVVLCFIKRDWNFKYKRILIGTHLILFLLIPVTVFLINFRGTWFERLCVIAFLVTGSATFALFRKTLRFWQKIYFGCFVFYPIAAAVTFIIDRILFVIIASPLLLALVTPKTRFGKADYELRNKLG
jgi:hypothetical protein